MGMERLDVWGGPDLHKQRIVRRNDMNVTVLRFGYG